MNIFRMIIEWFNSFIVKKTIKREIKLNYWISKEKICYVYRDKVFYFKQII